LLAVLFLDHLNRSPHVAGDLENANPIAKGVHRIKMAEAVDRIFLAEAIPCRLASLSAASNWSIKVVIREPSGIASKRPAGFSARRFINNLSSRLRL
jgi:hypothetical protein